MKTPALGRGGFFRSYVKGLRESWLVLRSCLP